MTTTEPTGAYCPTCDGTGTLAHLHSMEGGASHVIAACATCDGTGLIPFPSCRRCGDTGYLATDDGLTERYDRCTCLGPWPRSAYMPPREPNPAELPPELALRVVEVVAVLVLLAAGLYALFGR